MKNTLVVNGQTAVIEYDPEIRMFRGSFLGLNGGADFYAASVDELETEAHVSLDVFLDACRENKIDPFRSFSGRFNLRLRPSLHEAAALSAAAESKSLNEWVSEAIERAASGS